MADQFANVIKFVGGETDTAVDLVASMEVGQLAVCPFEDCLVWKQSSSAFTRYPNDARTISLIGSNSVEEAPIDGKQYVRFNGVWQELIGDADAKIDKWKGYVDPDNYETPYDPATRTVSVTPKTGTQVQFYCKGALFDLLDTDPKNSIVLPTIERKYWLYRDDNGQLSYETVMNSDSVIRNNTLDAIVNLKDDTAGSGFWIENLTIERWEDAQSNPVENFASYKTKGVQSTSNQVQFSGTLNGSVVGHTGGEYLTNRDFQFFALAENETVKQWVVYYLDGTDADGDYIERHVPSTLGVPYFTDGADLQYNLFNGSTWSAQPVDNNKYVICHFAVADNFQTQVTAIMGQAQYANLSTAQNSIVSERSNLVTNSEVFRDSKIIGSCIFQNSSGTGLLQYADQDNNLFNYPVDSEVSTGGGSSVIPNINTVMRASPNAGVVDISGDADGDRIFTFIKDGINRLTVFGSGLLASLQANIETLGSAFALVTTKLNSEGKSYFGKENDLGAVVNIDEDSVAGFEFASSPNPEPADGVYTDQGDGTQNGDTIYQIQATGYYLFKMLVSGQNYWAVHTSIVDGDANWNNVLYRQISAGTTPDGVSYEGLTVNGAQNTQGGASATVTNPIGLASNLPMKLKVTPDGSDIEDLVNEQRLQNVVGGGANTQIAVYDANGNLVGYTDFVRDANGNIQIGDKTITGTETPKSISLGATYSTTAGENFKIKVYEAVGAVAGMGISEGQLDIGGTFTLDHVFHSSGSEKMRITNGGIATLPNSTIANINSAGAKTVTTKEYVDAKVLLSYTRTITGLNPLTEYPIAVCNGAINVKNVVVYLTGGGVCNFDIKVGSTNIFGGTATWSPSANDSRVPSSGDNVGSLESTVTLNTSSQTQSVGEITITVYYENV